MTRTDARRLAGWSGAGVLAVATALSVLAVRWGGGGSIPFAAGGDLGLTTRGPAAVLLPVVLGVATLVLVVATATRETSEPRFVLLMLGFTAAAVLTVLASTLPALLLGWELMGAASYALIGYRWTDPHRVASGLTAFLTTRFADLGLYAATAAALAGGTDLSLDALTTLDGVPGQVAAAGALVAALGKAAQLPFSFWLARAMDGPAPVSALLHSAAMVALGGYLLVRLSPLLAASGWADDAAAWIGATTAVVLGAVAVVQTDLKLLLAASTSAQLGFVVMAAGVGTAHLVAHASVKALLFLAAGAWLQATGSKQLGDLVGAARRWPALGALSVAALLALAGVPPLSLWATKDAVLAAAGHRSLALETVGLVGAALAAAYAITALVVLLRPVQDDAASGDRVPARVPLALAPLAVGAIVLGALALPAVSSRLPGEVPAEPSPAGVALSTALVMAVGAVTAVLRWRGDVLPVRWTDPLRGWLGLERAAHALVVRPTLRLADGVAAVDDRLLAPAVAMLGRGTLRLAGAVGEGERRQSAAVHALGGAGLRGGGLVARAERLLAALVDGVARGAGTGSATVRRSSGTGQLHHYYLQVTGALLLVVCVPLLVLLLTNPR